jgi:hypothetical protein
MRIAIWDVLTVLTLVAICIIGAVFAQILTNPSSSLNPFPPQALPPTIVIPTSTATLRSLPPTWTPGGGPTQSLPSSTVGPSSTPFATSTGFVLPSFTPTPTNTFTATVTRTPTRTLTSTPIPTQTNTPQPTDNLTATANSLLVTQEAGTSAAETQAAQQTQAAHVHETETVSAQQTVDFAPHATETEVCLETQTALGTCP